MTELARRIRFVNLQPPPYVHASRRPTDSGAPNVERAVELGVLRASANRATRNVSTTSTLGEGRSRGRHLPIFGMEAYTGAVAEETRHVQVPTPTTLAESAHGYRNPR